METLMNETEVSEKLQVSLASLRRWRILGKGPAFVKLGSLVRYRPEEIQEWVETMHKGFGSRTAVPRRPPARHTVMTKSLRAS